MRSSRILIDVFQSFFVLNRCILFQVFLVFIQFSRQVMDSCGLEDGDDNVSVMPHATGLSSISKISSGISSSNIEINDSTLHEVPPEIKDAICDTLELEYTDQKDKIISDILISGRQSLNRYQDVLVPEIFSREINPETNNNDTVAETDLLKTIKKYVYQRWQKECAQFPVVWNFIESVKSENPDHFEMVLVRAAEYGNTYTKSSSILSIVLQLLFTGIDDECLVNEPRVFADLWSSITKDGISVCGRFKEYIPEDDLKEQINDVKSPLFEALHMYYEQAVPKLLKQHKIPDTKNGLYKKAVDSIAEHGWSLGIEAIKGRIPPNRYRALMEQIQEMISSSSTTAEQPKSVSTESPTNTQLDQAISETKESGKLLKKDVSKLF